eukprot:Unigene8422_Nuclearia_a/m.25779 Unigene8422_Nuclearia_a/g.25779  ORF Unigene8422_Nuclearia_a/g.25779 Unigene8422_Nuclearia_a/m.25779 type:complete len:505 (-) Unigene8422_Nuclearia_a:62-1576(-)
MNGTHDEAAPAVGIDIGTEYCCVAWVKDGRVETIPNEDGERSTPSYVAFADDELVAGTAAKAQVVRNRGNTVTEFKQMLGRSFGEIQAHAKRWPFKVVEKDGGVAVEVHYKDQTTLFTPEEITGFMVQRMKETAEAFIGAKVTEAVLTVPAHFDKRQRDALRVAAAKANLKVLRLINEPTAAALAFNAESTGDEDKTVVVVDVASSVSVSVLESHGGIFQLVKHHVEPSVGSRDFDDKLVNHFSTEFKRKTKHDIADSAKALTKLRLAAEMTKRTLSQSSTSPISVESLHEGEDLRSNIDRKMYDVLIAGLAAKVLQAVDKTLGEAGLVKGDVSQVILTGGSASITKVSATLTQYFDGVDVKKDVFPDETAAAGAAIEASLLIADDDIDEAELISDVESLPVSLSTVDADGKTIPLLRRGAPVPAKRAKTFKLAKDQTKVQVTVYAGDKPQASDNTPVARLTLAEATAGGEVEVVVSIDPKGEAKLTLQDRTSGKAVRAVVPVA